MTSIRKVESKDFNFFHFKNYIESKFTLIFLFTTFGLLAHNNLNSQQCRYPNDVEIVKYPNSNRSTLIGPIKVMVYAVLKDDGITGVSFSEAESYMSVVKNEFLNDYNINLDYCIREIHSTYLYDNRDNYPQNCFNRDVITLKLHENCGNGACGRGGFWGLGQLQPMKPLCMN